ncbi:hypothetical protein Hanom_Chr05g00398291 [Helianthus anomalus]
MRELDVIAAIVCVALAAFQICLQVSLTSSLLADGMAVSGQVDVCFV